MAFHHYIAQRQVTQASTTETPTPTSATATGTDTTAETLETTNGSSSSESIYQEGDNTSNKQEEEEDSATKTLQTESTAVASTNTPTTQPNPGLGDGEVAGVAVGCLAAGLLIGVIFGWFLRRAMRRSKHQKGGHGSEERAKMLSQPKDEIPVALEPLGKKMKLENVILQPASDSKIVSDLGRLEDIIRQHVEAVYHSGPVDVEIVTLANTLTALGISKKSSGFDAEAVAGWCLQPGTRRGALQHVISHVLFRSIDWNSPGPLTLLPKPAVDFLHSIRPVKEYRDNFDVMSFAWTRWRTLSALFLHPAPNERTPLELSEPDVQDQAEAVANALDSVLHFFVAPDQESRRKQRGHLHVMIIDAAKLV
ncbi:hypothetical protein CEP54_011199 [Fusarium duplospermum]|uniref:Uncharacterized protein n=1 Tax=Fusarium duplospermum TaxID=1325734 RepID=A0A428PFP2_9HYPO|nr:hypothetical protein CEP54_011199 [Fusarium duplospermum]